MAETSCGDLANTQKMFGLKNGKILNENICFLFCLAFAFLRRSSLSRMNKNVQISGLPSKIEVMLVLCSLLTIEIDQWFLCKSAKYLHLKSCEHFTVLKCAYTQSYRTCQAFEYNTLKGIVRTIEYQSIEANMIVSLFEMHRFCYELQPISSPSVFQCIC